MPTSTINIAGLVIDLKGLEVERNRGVDGNVRPLDTLKILKGTDVYEISGKGAANAHHWLCNASLPVSKLENGVFTISAQEVLTAARVCDRMEQKHDKPKNGYVICQKLRDSREHEIRQIGSIPAGILY